MKHRFTLTYFEAGGEKHCLGTLSIVISKA
jgi:hypothetical protein